MVPKKSGSTRPTVLVAHPDVDSADRFADCLGSEYAVRRVNSGEAMLEQLSADVDVVIVDRELGDTAGEIVFGEARARGFEGRGVLLTDTSPERDHFVQQFDDYLVTPVSRAAVEDAVERMVERNAFDAKIQDVLSLVSRMATLESKLSIEELRTSETYARLDAQLDDLRKNGVEMDSLNRDEYAEFSSEKLRVVLN